MIINRIIFIIICFITITTSIEAEYILKKDRRYKSKIDHMPKALIADMQRIPQDPAYYAKQIRPFSSKQQKQLDQRFNRKYFKPWEIDRLDIPKKDFGWEIRFITKKPIYREDGTIIPASTYRKWFKNAQYKYIDTKKYKAITIKHTDVKALPTSQSFYRNPGKTGEGFPFDYNQNSSLHINVPLYISHFSRDKKWAFVRASYSFGWVRVSDIALVDEGFVKKFKNGHYAVTIKDNLRLYDADSKQVCIVKLGALFPIDPDNNKRYLVAKRKRNGYAAIEKVRAKGSEIIARKPLAFTPKNVALVAREFYNEPYGWGGGYECRDCSATTRDFLGVFGIFLRRNSSKQALDGKQIRLKKWPKWYKKRFINKHAKPFRSLLYVPGHIVLYIGQYKGEPVIMHTYWGIRKKDGTKLITGRTIISTTEPGKERKDIKERSKLINTLRTIVNFD